MLNSQENYEQLSEALKDIANEIELVEDGARTIEEIQTLALEKNED